MPDLLPDDFGTETLQPPITILREQAEYLGRRTGGVVLADVYAGKWSAHEGFILQFVLEVPNLEGYTFTLFFVAHPIHFYPLDFRSDIAGVAGRNGINDQTEFENALREFFAHSEVRKVVAALKAQAMATVGANAKP